MSVIAAYREPQDILFKLLREGRRAWLSENIEDKCDHFFNYCVTTHSLRDWCINYLKLEGASKSDFHDEMNNLSYLAECRDIANASKHFTLNTRTLVSTAFLTKSEFVTITGEENQSYYDKTKELDISISLSNGDNLDLFTFLYHTSKNWITVLQNKHIPTNPGFNPIYIFIERG